MGTPKIKFGATARHIATRLDDDGNDDNDNNNDIPTSGDGGHGEGEGDGEGKRYRPLNQELRPSNIKNHENQINLENPR